MQVCDDMCNMLYRQEYQKKNKHILVCNATTIPFLSTNKKWEEKIKKQLSYSLYYIIRPETHYHNSLDVFSCKFCPIIFKPRMRLVPKNSYLLTLNKTTIKVTVF
jgi:hypothetical protein